VMKLQIKIFAFSISFEVSVVCYWLVMEFDYCSWYWVL